MFAIERVHAREILDSRGRPTVEVEVSVKGASGRAAAPSGASTGATEALEIRDHDDRYHGRGVRKAVQNVNGYLARALKGLDVRRLRTVDRALVRQDPTKDKHIMGGNAITATSLACAKCAANAMGIEFYHFIDPYARKMPVPMFNVINGGKHAGSGLAIQEFMIVPRGARKFSEALRMGSEIYEILGNVLEKKYGAVARGVGDEGGYAPRIKTTREALDAIEKAIRQAGYGKHVVLALDCAATSFYDVKKKTYLVDGKHLARDNLISYYRDLCRDYPIVSIEDPLDEQDFGGFAYARKRLGKVLVVGDDLLTTNLERLQKAEALGSVSALLLKVNQVGTLTEALDAAVFAHGNGMKVIVSHRSGETCDDSIADIAVGIGAELIKAGAPARGERVAKYNRLLRIEEKLGDKAMFLGASAFA
ncbi:Enolase [Candidatus Burarchaeum australiense]|nr:Enolase [Candidatus Burarchaeum australiense]